MAFAFLGRALRRELGISWWAGPLTASARMARISDSIDLPWTAARMRSPSYRDGLRKPPTGARRQYAQPLATSAKRGDQADGIDEAANGRNNCR